MKESIPDTQERNNTTVMDELQAEKSKNHELEKKIAQLSKAYQKERQRNVERCVAIEAEEERITNILTKRLNEINLEKEILVNEVEREGEQVTNRLQKQLKQLRQEKIDLENQLEQEQEFVVNKLQKQLVSVKTENQLLENAKQDALSVLVQKLQKNVDKMEEAGYSDVLLKELSSQVSTLLETLDKEKKIEELEAENKALKYETEKLRDSNFILTQRLEMEDEKLSEALCEKLKLESGLEQEDERLFNLSARKNSFDENSSVDTNYFGTNSSQYSTKAIGRSTTPNSTSAFRSRRNSVDEIMLEARQFSSQDSSKSLDVDVCPILHNNPVPVTPTMSYGNSARRTQLCKNKS